MFENRQYLTTKQLAYNAVLVGFCIFFLSLLGIVTRPSGLLAAFWPANAALLGVFIRFPHFAHPFSWGAAFIGYIFADVIVGLNWSLSLFLTVGNFAGVFVGYVLFKRLSFEHQRLKQPLSVIFLGVTCMAAAGAAGIVGTLGYPIFFNGPALQGFTYWFSTELVNFLAILPVILTIPEKFFLYINRSPNTDYSIYIIRKIAPLLTLIAGMLLGIFVGGPGALSFLIPGLLWCALSYSLFYTALLTLISSMWLLLTVATGLVNLGVNIRDLYTLESFRLGVTLTALAPLTVASVMVARNELVDNLQYASTHDQLTQILNRMGFYAKVQKALKSDKPSAMLMCDIDHFKQVNDLYGHASGDLVLAEFARRTEQSLCSLDIFGRLGGEEFGVLLIDCSKQDALTAAQRICHACSSQEFLIEDGISLNVTVSIGLAYSTSLSSIEIKLGKADDALYEAKELGRNRVVSDTH